MSAQDKDVGAIGRTIYKDKILKALDERADKGKLGVIDVESGDYETADGTNPNDDMAAEKRMRSRRPDAVTWAERVGYPVPYYMVGMRVLDSPEIPVP